MSCKLCDLEKKTFWFYEGNHIIICNCLKCGYPIIVLKEHVSELTKGARKEIDYVFRFLAKQDSTLEHYSVKKEVLEGKPHLYWHIVKSDCEQN